MPFPSRLPDLRSELFKLLRQIPSGMVTTYGDLARALGDPQARSARWIGEFLSNHPHDSNGCRCHRVVRKTGEIGLYAGDVAAKRELLKLERVPFDGERVDLDSCRFSGFKSTFPLKELMSVQEEWSQTVTFKPVKKVSLVAGLDVAYLDETTAVGAFVLLDAASLAQQRTLAVTRTITFPYIPGFLSFRELPVLLALWRELTKKQLTPDVVFVDGNGWLHPRRAGIASCFGVLAGIPTIGVGKSLLCGSYGTGRLTPNSPQPVTHREEIIGYALQARTGSKPIHVSPGNLITPEQAVVLTQRAFAGHRLPEPVFLADRLTKSLRDQLRSERN